MRAAERPRVAAPTLPAPGLSAPGGWLGRALPTLLRARPAAGPLPTVPLLWTLGALAFSMLPFAARLPLWLSLLLAALLGVRALIAVRGWRQPPAWTLLVAALVISRALIASFSLLAGRDGGTALLLVLVCLKTLETGRRRDALLLVLCGYFVTASNFFFGQDTVTALHALISALLLTACAALWQRPQTTAGAQAPQTTLRQAGRLLLQAAPLAAALFVLFPRPDGPLWQMPVSSSTAARSGLTDTVTPGSVSQLAQSDELAFRASFQGALPPPSARYWRGPVLERFDGRSWSQLRAPLPAPQLAVGGPQYRYSITLEPSDQPWALALDVPTSSPDGTLLTGTLQLLRRGSPDARTRLDLTAATTYRYGLNAPRNELSYDTALPPGGNPRARALAAGWAGLPPAARVEAALNYFRSSGFGYTLEPPLLTGGSPVDELLFGTRLGFCEHWAGSFAYLMRAAGVPARLVTGYLGGQENRDASGSGSYLMVRQADAHAWVEVWLPGQGWVRVDPTAAVSPARLTGGLAAAVPAAQLPSLLREGGALERLRLRLDALQNAWNGWIVGYDAARQQSLLTRLGLGEIGGWKYALTLVGALMVASIPLLLLARLRRRPQAPLLLAYRRYAARLGLPMRPEETPGEYAHRASLQRPQLARDIGHVTAEYLSLRYGPVADPARERAFIRAARMRAARRE